MSKPSVYFLTGFTPRKGLLGVAAFPYGLEGNDVEFTRFYMTRDGQWAHREFNVDVVAVSYTNVADDRSWWLLNKRGKVISSSSKGLVEEEIPDAGTGPGKFGYLSDLRLIGDTLYTVGLGRQIYRREKNGIWACADTTMRVDSTKYGFRAIDGRSQSDIHAVGYGGEVWYFDGAQWKQAKSPTNKTLESVRYAANGVYYACGKDGILIRGYQDTWEVIGSDVETNLWGLEIFQDIVYASGPQGLYTVKDGRLRPLDLGRIVEGRKLYSNVEELWSVEHHELWVFDGKDWRQNVCPDNV